MREREGGREAGGRERERENLWRKIDERSAEVSGTHVAVRSVTPPKLI